ncbi:thioesterase family protein [Paraflavitalea speifideaquila]|uniref:acyl-CoA thioesterase n=1 Tax=Paraflavitalea speifideaquila TaxID=3076558 RepID=UPI0028E1D237|nr:thioesterase family protein [Paraflavitalea speifideiaquila]
MAQHYLGPILFREECIFSKEIKLGDAVTIDLHLSKAKEDQSRWSIQHHIYKNADTLAAIITVDGAWINTQLRKLAAPPEQILHVFNNMPRAEGFEWIK